MLSKKVAEHVRQHGNIARGSRHRDAVKDIQYALRYAGHEIVPDGDFGPITHTAVRQFQALYGVLHDGVVGPITAGLLDGAVDDMRAASAPMESVLKVAPHLARMRAMTGIKEYPGGKDNPIILEWVDGLEKRWPAIKGHFNWYNADSIAWCGLGMAASTSLGDHAVEPPKELLRALAWARWGIPVDTAFPGVIMVKAREGGGHVTQYESEDKDYWYCRGANQNDMVCVSRYPKAKTKWVAMRWPAGIPFPENTLPKWGVTGNVVAGAKES